MGLLCSSPCHTQPVAGQWTLLGIALVVRVDPKLIIEEQSGLLGLPSGIPPMTKAPAWLQLGGEMAVQPLDELPSLG